MMTCRLLCALLVLALCCCPSVCVTASDEGTAGKAGEHSDPAKSNLEVTNQVAQLPGKSSLPPKISEGGIGTAESQSDLNQAQGQENDEKPTNEEAGRHESENAKDQNQKTNAINKTTTTTTTTTTAPEASSTTNTEAQTTTTTRAPSHLREMDGSLSGSAWVCAPLLLAVSALAYTTVG
ncbi:putative mucin TcMUCII [Trypanosoma cruzi]|uniref:Mucin TcMUCII, putative n=2 Tax=Trypanosoma cruzi TaxID=5693 RepID=Q4E450_TRYCC|nr:mucin TcMUCII, putative [Trypanosoma cruzi]EAN99572.1 mucin TcMUCII, putative [Trypanosoma cruzi]PWV21287.1 putative mucin TcMUCII [Trypanosoma cruzi]RNC41242.1 mucin TcMUCII [Trypanosoma cruzi]|eukprot:XP_821423.1 mucin TcMUCII [Trypanosoma cruzi strain CL Brener]